MSSKHRQQVDELVITVAVIVALGVAAVTSMMMVL